MFGSVHKLPLPAIPLFILADKITGQGGIVNDMKGELWGQTAGWRKEHANNVVIKFDPAAPDGSGRFNPPNEIRIDTINAVGDTQNLVTMIVDPDGRGLNDHWTKTNHALLTGLVLHILHKRWEEHDLGKQADEATLYTVAFYLPRVREKPRKRAAHATLPALADRNRRRTALAGRIVQSPRHLNCPARILKSP